MQITNFAGVECEGRELIKKVEEQNERYLVSFLSLSEPFSFSQPLLTFWFPSS